MLTRSEHSALTIEGARVIDPISQRDEVADVFVVDGKIAAEPGADAHKVDASGLIVSPGFWDIHVHLREPGQTHKETIESGTLAAASGGFTLVACMPNTAPALDTPEAIRLVLDRSSSVASATVLPTATITKGRKGEELTDFASLKEAGAVAFTDDGDGVEDDAIMLAAFEQAAKVDTVLIQHCEYKAISDGGVMHLGTVSKQIGMPGLDPRSEEAMIDRDIDLCRKTGGRYHVAHISTAKAVELVRKAKREGLPVTSEVCTHHLLLTDDACSEADPNTKMHPPLRPQSDVDACRQGLLDGTIDCIVTDHAPHAANEKDVGFLKAPAGIVGLETAVGIAAEAMIGSGLADWGRLVEWFTSGPVRVLHRTRKGIVPGGVAELTLIDPEANWCVTPEQFLSLGRNTPFAGRSLVGKPVGTVRGTAVAIRAATAKLF
jgi:dihydroorotase